jgi:hypothetical protein
MVNSDRVALPISNPYANLSARASPVRHAISSFQAFLLVLEPTQLHIYNLNQLHNPSFCVVLFPFDPASRTTQIILVLSLKFAHLPLHSGAGKRHVVVRLTPRCDHRRYQPRKSSRALSTSTSRATSVVRRHKIRYSPPEPEDNRSIARRPVT